MIELSSLQLVSRIPDGLGDLRDLLENHITLQGLAAIEKLGEEALNDPKIYVSTILEVHRKYNALVLTAFNNDSGFVASLDKACGELAPFYTERDSTDACLFRKVHQQQRRHQDG